MVRCGLLPNGNITVFNLNSPNQMIIKDEINIEFTVLIVIPSLFNNVDTLKETPLPTQI